MIFPAVMQIDYVRVYQRASSVNVGCDPVDYPTADYINKHPTAYQSAWLLSHQMLQFTHIVLLQT